jgi:hypothetical protein
LVVWRRVLLVVPSWTGLVSAICLARLFTAPSLTFGDFGLIFAASVAAGVVVGDLENAIVAFAGALLLSGTIIGLVLSLPSILGLSGLLYSSVDVEEALGSVFKIFIPFGLAILLAGSILGSALAERYGLD